MTQTIVIQIGNSDNKLTQAQWADFCQEISSNVKMFGDVHFLGHSHPDAPWQNMCMVIAPYHLNEKMAVPQNVEAFDKMLRTRLSKIAAVYKQDSIAMTTGTTDFVEAST